MAMFLYSIILKIYNIHFFKNNRKLDRNLIDIRNADYVAITFKSQKNGDKFQTVIQHT